MIHGSVCSGIEAASVAWGPLGWKPAFFAEVEPYCCALLRHYWPDVPNLGDITAEDFRKRAAGYKIDVLVGGTPCQAFSVAGLRQSLKDERSNLTLRFVRIADATQPRYVVWENVPGVLTTTDNAFGCFLGALVGADSALVPPLGLRWTDAGVVDGPARSAAWRILDAQYFGLAQRRKRVFLVASSGDGTHPGEILFEREGVQGHLAPSREAGQRTTGTLAARTSAGGGQDPVIAMGLNAKGGSGRLDGESETFVTHALRGDGFNASEHGTGRGTPLVARILAVRRLTPRECERLQGMPDDWTQIPYRGQPAADGPRYRVIGNSMAVPVMRWIGERIDATERKDAA